LIPKFASEVAAIAYEPRNRSSSGALTFNVNATFAAGPKNFKLVELEPDVAYVTCMNHRLSVVVAWLALAFIVFVTLSPVELRPSIGNSHLEHFGAFALVGLAFAFAYPNRILTIVAIVVGAALGLEALQLLTPDRHARATDALVKALGGISGICTGQLTYFLIRVRSIQPDHST
jgi:VanZ like protein